MNIFSNFQKLNWITICRNSMFLMPVMVLFFQDIGLTLGEVFILQSIFSLAVVVLEIPTGYLWDILRRKDWLIIGWICTALWFLWFHFADWFLVVAIAEIFLALWYTFFSWSDTALIYDSLLEVWKEEDFKKIKWRYLAYWSFSEAWWALIWGALVLGWYEWVTLWQVVLACIWVLISMRLVEPTREKFEVNETWFKHLLWLVKYAFIWNNTIASLVIYSAVTWLATMFWVWLSQPYWELLWVPLYLFWLLRALWNFSVGLFSWFWHTIIEKIWTINLLIILPVLTIITYVIYWVLPLLLFIPLMLTFYASRAVLWIVYFDVINKLVSSKERATILSVKSLAFRWLFMIFWPLIGILADQYWIQIAMISSGVILLILLIFSLLLMKRNLIFEKLSSLQP